MSGVFRGGKSIHEKENATITLNMEYLFKQRKKYIYIMFGKHEKHQETVPRRL